MSSESNTGSRVAHGRAPLDLCHAAIDEQFRSRDVAAVVGSEKDDGLRDLAGSTEPAEGNGAGKHLQALLARARGIHQVMQAWRQDRTRTHRVHANVPGPSSRSSMSSRTNARRPWWRCRRSWPAVPYWPRS